MTLSTRRLAGHPAYDGSQIDSLWAYREQGIQGDSLVAWTGRCSIPFAKMIDQDDVRRRSRIRSPLMLHFVAEHFDLPPELEKAVLRQRLFAALAAAELGRRDVRRDGDDLWWGRRKLSISIACVTPVSTKFHFGINVRRETGVDVPTASLADVGADPERFADALLRAYSAELAGVADARTRSRGAR